MVESTPQRIADELDLRVRALPAPSTESIRQVRREATRALEDRSGDDVLRVAIALVDRHRWMAYELVHHHLGAQRELDVAIVERLGEGFGN